MGIECFFVVVVVVVVFSSGAPIRLRRSIERPFICFYDQNSKKRKFLLNFNPLLRFFKDTIRDKAREVIPYFRDTQFFRGKCYHVRCVSVFLENENASKPSFTLRRNNLKTDVSL